MVLSSVGDHILQEFNTLYMTNKTYKIARPPQRNLGGEGPQTDKHLSQSPFTCKLFEMTTLH